MPPSAVAGVGPQDQQGAAMSRFSARMADIDPFRVVEVLTRARQLEAAGRDILHLEIGEPDFTTAQPICEAAIRALRSGHTGYTPALGIEPLREAIAGWYASEYGLSIAPGRIVVTPGASGAILLLTALLVSPGDRLLLTDPGYPCNRHFIRLVEGRATLVPVSPVDHYHLTPAAVEAHWDDRTIGAMVASPANPTGEVMNRAQLQALWGAVRQRDGSLIVDEIYHGLNYDGPAPSILEITDDCYVVSSFSKYFGMTGWRLGWLVAPTQAVPELEKLAQNLFIAPSTPAQHAALACFEPATRDILNERRDLFRARRDFLFPELCRMGFAIPQRPAGGFYLYAGIDRLAADSQAFCFDLLERHGVALTPGADFGRHRADQHVRFAYTSTMHELERAVARLQRVCR